MDLTKLERWKGALSIAIAIASPFAAWGMDETSLRAAVVLGVIGGLTALHNWIDQSLDQKKVELAKREATAEVKAYVADPDGE